MLYPFDIIISIYNSYPDQSRLRAFSWTRPDHRKAAAVDAQVNH